MRRVVNGLFTSACLISASPVLAQFTPEQEGAFAQGAGVTGENFAAFLAALVVALTFGGMAWIVFAAYQQWTRGQSSVGSVASLLVRASVLVIVVGLFLG